MPFKPIRNEEESKHQKVELSIDKTHALENSGLKDFLVSCSALKVTPPHINELLMAMMRIPGTALWKLNHNREDGAAFSPNLRAIVHDKRPYVHELVKALVGYYDTGDGKDLRAVLDLANEQDHDSYSKQFEGISQEVGLYGDAPDRAFYERHVVVSGRHAKERAIDILRCLLKNTVPTVEKLPVTSDLNINEKLVALAKNGKDKTLESAFVCVNDKLKNMMAHGDIGIEPNMIFALAWLEGKGFEKLQSLTFEDQLSAYAESWFAAILEFQELTASPSSFDPEEFQKFLGRVKRENSMMDAYRLIVSRTLDKMAALGEIYKAKGMADTDPVWSGNIADQLIGLRDLRKASTTQGKKAVEEEKRKILEPDYHPGD